MDGMKLVKLDYHRNGVCGEGFHVVLFDWTDGDSKKSRRMVATVFEGPGVVSVFDVGMLAEGNVIFAGGNSWRGDYFEKTLRKWISRHESDINAESASAK